MEDKAKGAEAPFEKKQTATPRARTQYQLDRQSECFMLSVEGWSIRAIAQNKSLACNTVLADIKAEQAVRADQIRERAESEKARSVSFYESVAKRAIRKAEVCDRILDSIASGGDAKLTEKYLDTAIKARERIDKILGLDAPTKVEIGIATLIESLIDVPDDDASPE